MYKVITPEDTIDEIKKLDSQAKISKLLSNPKFGGNPDIHYNIYAYINNHYDCVELAGPINLNNHYPVYHCGDGKLVNEETHKPVSLKEAKQLVITAISAL